MGWGGCGGLSAAWRHLQAAASSDSLSVPSELHTQEWAQPRPTEGAEEPARRQETTAAREDDSDTDLTYGEVEQRLDLLQQHLNR